MGVDVGAARIGIALSQGTLALAHDTLAAGENAHAHLLEIARNLQVEKIFVGLPLSLSGERTKSSEVAIDFAKEVAKSADAQVLLVDERLTTVSAQRQLREAGKNTRQARSMIDAESARSILEFALAAPHVAIAIEDLDA